MNKKIPLSFCIVFLLVLMSSCVFGSQRMYTDDNDIIAYYGLDTPAGTSGYTYAISTEEGVFYMSDEQADILGKRDFNLHRLIQYDLSKYSDSFTPDAVSFGSGGLNYYYTFDHSKDTDMFQIENSQEFAFEYKDGQTVGYNNNAKVITKLYNMDGSLMK